MDTPSLGRCSVRSVDSMLSENALTYFEQGERSYSQRRSLSKTTPSCSPPSNTKTRAREPLAFSTSTSSILRDPALRKIGRNALQPWPGKELPNRKKLSGTAESITLATMAEPKDVVSHYRSLNVTLDSKSAWEDLARQEKPRTSRPASVSADRMSINVMIDEQDFASADDVFPQYDEDSVTSEKALANDEALMAVRRRFRPPVEFAPISYGATQLLHLEQARQAARSGCDRVDVAIQAINSLMPIQMVAIEHLYALYADCKPTSFSLARASLTPSRWLVFCRHMLRQPASLELLLSLPVLTSLYERFERRRQQAHESKGQAASPLGVGPFIGLLCEVADHWERRNALAPPEPPSSPSSSGYRAAAAAATCPTTSPDRGLFEAVRQKLRLPADLPPLLYLLDRIARLCQRSDELYHGHRVEELYQDGHRKALDSLRIEPMSP